MIILMKSTCLSVCRQGWLGVPLFLLGVVSLAFSQLGQEPQQEAMTAEELSRSVSDGIKQLKLRINGLQKEQSGTFLVERKEAIGGNLSQVSAVRGNSDPTVVRLQANLEAVEEAFGSHARGKRSKGCPRSRVGCWKHPRFSMIWMRILPVAWKKRNLLWAYCGKICREPRTN